MREEVTFTKGRVIVCGKLHTRGQARRADYVLYQQAKLRLAVIEAKDNSHGPGEGMQQALDYAEALDDRSSHGTCKLVSEKLWSVEIGVPPLAEQHRIVAKVTALLALCDQLKARIAAARAKHAQLAEALVAQAAA